jgi:hypothetical protein
MPQSRQARKVGPEPGGDVVTGLATLGILEALAQDPRPTFILDLVSTKESQQPSQMVYRNPALHSHFALNELISGRAIGHSDLEYIRFCDWTMHQEERENSWSPHARRSFGGMSWTAYTVRTKYRIISGHLEKDRDVRPVSDMELTGEDKDIVPGEIRAMQILPDDIR